MKAKEDDLKANNFETKQPMKFLEKRIGEIS